MNIKNILSWVLAIVAGYFLIKIFWWILGTAFSIAITLFQIVFILILAAPLYLIIRRKLLS